MGFNCIVAEYFQETSRWFLIERGNRELDVTCVSHSCRFDTVLCHFIQDYQSHGNVMRLLSVVMC